jgi:hypothetical protein
MVLNCSKLPQGWQTEAQPSATASPRGRDYNILQVWPAIFRKFDPLRSCASLIRFDLAQV